jgi:anti-sigma regulatory factor (Ser/Thr protein kinase)
MQTSPANNGTMMYAFELKNDLSELENLGRHVKHCARIIDLSDDCCLDINLSLDELFTNVVSYGFEDNLGHLIRFSLQIDFDRLIICVEDDGVPFNPLEAKEPDILLDQDDFKIGGLGIFIAKKLMDDIRYKREGGKNNLTLIKSIHAGEQPL